MENHPVVFVARQPGSAAALAPVVRALQKETEIPCLVLGLDHAISAWSTAGITAQAVASFHEARCHLTAIWPALLLTGTSFNAADDGLFWSWAWEQGIPSIAFVDHWTNYRKRFSSTPDRHFDCMPEQIAVIDDRMARRLVDAGCPEQRIIMLGHPGWDDLVARRDDHTPKLRQELAGDRILILFVSEPFARFYGPKGTYSSLGYTEVDALNLLFNVLETVGENLGETYTVIIKPHPRENSMDLTNLVMMASGYQRVQARLVDGDRLELVAAAKVVTGMSSLLLYEAALMGRPVVALQPGRIAPSDLVDHYPGILLATEHGQAISALTHALTGEISSIPAPKPVIPQWIKTIQNSLQRSPPR
ncbi:hypothetical protein CCP3SC5AM1_1170004 [Gammaproteobacteria bacterium]